MRESIQRIEATLETINEAIAGLQKSAELNSKSIEGLQVAAAQTDEVVEHVVEAFGMMHKSLVERGDTKNSSGRAKRSLILPSALKPAAGTTLADRMAAGALPVCEALHYAIATGDAMRAMHRRGRPYAALQPAGVTIQEVGVQLTAGEPVAITPYFSPEQVLGREIDLRSDIFSLGALLYEMLARAQSVRCAHQTRAPFRDSGWRASAAAGCTGGGSPTVMRCLEKKPERRIQRMDCLLAALKLEEIIAGSVARSDVRRGNLRSV
ncbi:MAG: hypothetical protein WDO73_37830 [Ignavibacteriota bacterium]